MSRSAGTGSPVWFRCWKDRRSVHRVRGEHVWRLTGRKRVGRHRKGTAMGSRSSYFDREYECSCGYRGWSNHIDLMRAEGVSYEQDWEAFKRAKKEAA